MAGAPMAASASSTSGRRTRRSSRLPPQPRSRTKPRNCCHRSGCRRTMATARSRQARSERWGLVTARSPRVCNRLHPDFDGRRIHFSRNFVLRFLQRRKTKSSRDAGRGLMLASSKFSEMPPGPVLKQRRGTMMGVRCPLAVRAPTLGRQYNRLKSTAGDLTRSVSWGGDARRGDFRPVENSWAGEIQQNCDGDHGFLVTSQA